MNCHDCQELFSLYFDGEIEAQNKSLLEAHFSSCTNCRMEWNAFQNTINLIQSLPQYEVPPGFLAGIHAKIDSKTPFQKIIYWLKGSGERKVAISTAFAMLVIGFVSASMLQVVPFHGTQKSPEETPPTAEHVAQNETPEQAAVLAGNAEYYPGIPLLSEYEEGLTSDGLSQLAMIPRKTREHRSPVVDFVSTHNPMRESSYLSAPFSPYERVNQPPVIKPDLYITLHSVSDNEHVDTIRQIMQSQLWRAEVYNENTILLSVPAGNFHELHHICYKQTTTFSPDYVRNNLYISPKRLLTVAVRLD